jgi:2-iminobutanoate/2-iminopropanoate deaminase
VHIRRREDSRKRRVAANEIMPKQHLDPRSLFRSLDHGFSQVVVATGARIVYISGQTACDADKKIVGRTLEEQARQAFGNVQAAVESAGGNLDDIVALRLYVVREADQTLDPVGKALREWFPKNPPASTWIGVQSLAVPAFLIEIEAVAVLD